MIHSIMNIGVQVIAISGLGTSTLASDLRLCESARNVDDEEG
jgi:hypothetical protein